MAITATRMIESIMEYNVIVCEIEETICDMLEEHDSARLITLDDIEISCDWYDTSLTVTISKEMPEDYEIPQNVFNYIFGIGFDRVYWKFLDKTVFRKAL